MTIAKLATETAKSAAVAQFPNYIKYVVASASAFLGNHFAFSAVVTAPCSVVDSGSDYTGCTEAVRSSPLHLRSIIATTAGLSSVAADTTAISTQGIHSWLHIAAGTIAINEPGS